MDRVTQRFCTVTGTADKIMGPPNLIASYRNQNTLQTKVESSENQENLKKGKDDFNKSGDVVLNVTDRIIASEDPFQNTSRELKLNKAVNASQSTLQPQEDDENKENFHDISMQEDFNKSGDVVLISNKHRDVTELPKQTNANMHSVKILKKIACEMEYYIKLDAIHCKNYRQCLEEIEAKKNNVKAKCPMDTVNKLRKIARLMESSYEGSAMSSSCNQMTPKSSKINAKPTEEMKVVESEWIPIGGGATKVHKDQYKKVNWKTYTVATRTLLLAVFPRSVLATHSLTGKSSPAFQNKPPKMPLDQRKVADVVMEVSDRFKISKGLVRNIITTKCADECKMMKMRNKKAEKK